MADFTDVIAAAQGSGLFLSSPNTIQGFLSFLVLNGDDLPTGWEDDFEAVFLDATTNYTNPAAQELFSTTASALTDAQKIQLYGAYPTAIKTAWSNIYLLLKNYNVQVTVGLNQGYFVNSYMLLGTKPTYTVISYTNPDLTGPIPYCAPVNENNGQYLLTSEHLPTDINGNALTWYLDGTTTPLAVGDAVPLNAVLTTELPPTPYVVDSTSLTATADAIRTKSGTSAAIEWKASKGFADAVAAITSGISPDDIAANVAIPEIVITATDITGDGFSRLNVEKISAPNLTNISKAAAFNGNTYLTEVDFPLIAAPTGTNIFANCSALTTVNMPELTTIPSGMFSSSGITTANFPKATYADSFNGCTSLTSVNMPLVNEVKSYGFQQCTALQTITLPSLKYRLMERSFYNCTSLVTADISNSNAIQQTLSIIQTLAFGNCSALTTLIIRAPFVYALSNVNAFNGCSNLAHIYVPSDLVDSYKAATNWTTYASLISAIPS